MRKRLNSLVHWIGLRVQVALVGAAVIGSLTAGARAADLLIADRLANGVFRFSDSGALLGVVTREVFVPGVTPTYLYQPTGIAISPDYAKFYVSSSQLNQVVAYDYDRFTGTATNPTIFADGNDGLSFPNDIQFGPDGNTIYVANLNGGVSRFHLDGSSAGEKLLLPTVEGEGVTQTSSMNFMSDGRLLAGAFSDPSGSGGGIAISGCAVSELSGCSISEFTEYLVEPLPAIQGATGLMIHDDYIYVSGLFTGSIRRFSLSDGQIDPAWVVTGPDVSYPQDLLVAPDGNGFLAGILGSFPGAGRITRYAFDGTLLGTFALPSQGGLREATSIVVVPTLLIGDYNEDGTVDAADYTVWRDNLGSTNVLSNDDTPGAVDASDYEDWRTNFGKSKLAGSAAIEGLSIPEPASFLLLVGAILVGCMVRIRT